GRGRGAWHPDAEVGAGPVGADAGRVARTGPQHVVAGDRWRGGPDVRALGLAVTVEALAGQGWIVHQIRVVVVVVVAPRRDAVPLDPVEAGRVVRDHGDGDLLAWIDPSIIHLERDRWADR